MSYTVEVVSPFGRGREGLAKLFVTKDRPGYVRQFADGGRRVADVRLVSRANGSVELSLEEPPGGRETFRPTALMERVSRAVEESPGLLSGCPSRGRRPRAPLMTLSLDGNCTGQR